MTDRELGTMPTNGTIQFSLKFTKGDIVVNMGKLSFFHKKHIRQAIDALPSDSLMVDEILADPILQRARDIEVHRQEFQANFKQGDSEIESPLALLGSPLVNLREADREKALLQVHSILKISRNECITATEAVDANKFLIWRPSVQHIRNTFPSSRDDVANGETTKFVTNLMRLFMEAIGKIEAPCWTHDEIHSVLRETVEFACHAKPHISIAIVYRYLRWALLGLEHGPQVTSLVEFLGKEETIRRLQVAELVAKPVVSRVRIHEDGLCQGPNMTQPDHEQNGKQHSVTEQ